MKKQIFLLLIIFSQISCNTDTEKFEEQLLRISYESTCGHSERDFFLLLPKGYDSDNEKKWPVILFLHGDGERGDGKTDLDYVLKQGPLYEAWIQKRDLPFLIISPQLPMFGIDTMKGNEWLLNRKRDEIPVRMEQGTPSRPERFGTVGPMQPCELFDSFDSIPLFSPVGWEMCSDDIMKILETVLKDYRADVKKIYLTGLSSGGYGTWYFASRYPESFAAISPVVGWGHPSLMKPIAKANLPVWCFAAGRDRAVELKYFYAGMNKLEEEGNTKFRFTVEEDMNHDAWDRVYSGDDLYNWFLQYKLP